MEKPDYMSETEWADLQEMKSKIKAKKESAYDYMKDMLRYTQQDLNSSGYGKYTVTKAIRQVLERSVKDIEKLHKDYIKKYPDEK